MNDKTLQLIEKFINSHGNKHHSKAVYYRLLKQVRKMIGLQLKMYDKWRDIEKAILQKAKKDGHNL